MSFLDSIFGIKRITVNGVELPSRGTLAFVGAGITGTDEPESDRTVVTFGGTTTLAAALMARKPKPESEEPPP